MFCNIHPENIKQRLRLAEFNGGMNIDADSFVYLYICAFIHLSLSSFTYLFISLSILTVSCAQEQFLTYWET